MCRTTEPVGVRLLGPVGVLAPDGRSVAIGPKERALLAALAVTPDATVSEDRLAEVLWSETPPPTATKTLRSYISRLRKALGDTGSAIVTEPSGYRLVTGGIELDTWVVDELRRMAAAASDAGQHGIAAALCRDALANWRGSSLGDLAAEPWAAADASRLEELRLTILESRVEEDLACGRHLELVGELEALTSTHPYRERLWAARMLALYRSGRQADALRACAELRRILVDELGLEPCAEVRMLEGRILRQDPTLAPDGAGAATSAQEPAGLPSGVVTFLLTDVVGSTRRWEGAPQLMADAMARHDHLLAVSVSEAGGRLLKARGEGDSTFSVFRRTSDAARAALAALAALELPVRMAIHVGQAVERDGDYYGPAVNRAARLRGIAGSGEILLSRSAADMLLDEPSTEWSILEVGQRELKDLSRPEHVFRLLPGADLDREIEPPASIERRALDQDLPLPVPLAMRGDHVARPHELEQMLAAFGDVVAGGRRTVLLAGEPGMGKTWLAAALGRHARDAGALVLLGRCDDEFQLPLQAIAEALRPLIDALSTDRLRTLEHAGELGRLLPSGELAGLGRPTHAGVDAEQWLLGEAVAEVLEHVSAERPVVLVVDDVHWAAKPLLLVLRHLMRTQRTLRVLLVATYRTNEVGRDHPLASALADLRREPGTLRLLLHGLDIEALGGLVALHRPAEDAFVADLHDETGGNPFFAMEVLRSFDESDGADHLPEGVRDVLSPPRPARGAHERGAAPRRCPRADLPSTTADDSGRRRGDRCRRRGGRRQSAPRRRRIRHLQPRPGSPSPARRDHHHPTRPSPPTDR